MPTHSSEPQQASGGIAQEGVLLPVLRARGIPQPFENSSFLQFPPSLAFVLPLGRITLSSRLPQRSGDYSSVPCSHTPLASEVFPPKGNFPTNTRKTHSPCRHTEEKSAKSAEEGGHSQSSGGQPQPQAVPRAGQRRCSPHPSGQGTPHLLPGPSPVASAALADKSPEEAIIKTTGLLICREPIATKRFPRVANLPWQHLSEQDQPAGTPHWTLCPMWTKTRAESCTPTAASPVPLITWWAALGVIAG